ncbi:hypothetical protein B0H15DRAFT_871570 [Mycena belliarum]|uniref:Uncharacterized protein n=1 Tax=Mycena belliarum TaxID=1033014 RepID=A0AAD6TNW4_9AGAR|nr:hypothetical protein B0H15DRAFT_871570 [Mycena belliae]
MCMNPSCPRTCETNMACDKVNHRCFVSKGHIFGVSGQGRAHGHDIATATSPASYCSALSSCPYSLAPPRHRHTTSRAAHEPPGRSRGERDSSSHLRSLRPTRTRRPGAAPLPHVHAGRGTRGRSPRRTVPQRGRVEQRATAIALCAPRSTLFAHIDRVRRRALPAAYVSANASARRTHSKPEWAAAASRLCAGSAEGASRWGYSAPPAKRTLGRTLSGAVLRSWRTQDTRKQQEVARV